MTKIATVRRSTGMPVVRSLGIAADGIKTAEGRAAHQSAASTVSTNYDYQRHRQAEHAFLR